MKTLLSAIGFSLFFASGAFAADDIRILSCTVDFKQKNSLTTVRTQNNSWLLPVDKGSVSLESLGNVKVVLEKKLVNDTPVYRLRITEGKDVIGNLTINNHAFEYSAPLKLHVEDGEDGQDFDLIKVACDTGYAAG